MTEKQIVVRQNKHIENYNKAVASCNKSAWGLAKVVYETVKSEDFAEVFGTIGEYAKALNVSKGSVSKLAKAYERKLLLDNAENLESDYTVSQIQEFSTVDMEETEKFVDAMNVTPSDTCVVIREKVKLWTADTEETETDAEKTETDAEETETDESFIVMYKGVEYQITNEDIKKQILAILEFDE